MLGIDRAYSAGPQADGEGTQEAGKPSYPSRSSVKGLNPKTLKT